MPRDLLLVRAGASRRIAQGSPVSRELKDVGKRGAQKLGIWLCERGLHRADVMAARRADAMVCAEKLLKAAGQSANRIIADDRLAAARLDDNLAALARVGTGSAPLLCVGSKSAMRNLARHLGAERVTMAAGDMLHLRVADTAFPPGRGAGRVIAHIRPASLAADFPYPDIHGSERRARPAYYYRQSAALPYRREAGRLEVLIISSSRKNHWVLPKGICEPGLSAADSAAKEAWEEAGINGRIDGVSIGRFHQEKWGATCHVDVFPMQVTRIYAPQDWPERHRLRRWVSPQEAAAMVQNPGLAAILARFDAADIA